MSTAAPDYLVKALSTDLAVAARRLRSGDAEGAMLALMPLGLDEAQLRGRLGTLVAVSGLLGAYLIPDRETAAGTAWTVVQLIDELNSAAAKLDAAAVQARVTAQRPEVLVDALVELVRQFACAMRRVNEAGSDLRWYLRSMRDRDTHRGRLGPSGEVEAVCGAMFPPRRTCQEVGPPPGFLVDGPAALPGSPPDPAQVCPRCAEGQR